MISRLKPSLALAFLLLAGCDSGPAATSQPVAGAPTIDVVIAGRQFKLEVADTEKEREVGLMNRKSMPVDHGMLFVFQDTARRSFWMKNTLIPLDIAYLDDGGNVINIRLMYPNDLTPISSTAPARYAIELNQGISNKIGLKAGDHIELPATSAK